MYSSPKIEDRLQDSPLFQRPLVWGSVLTCFWKVLDSRFLRTEGPRALAKPYGLTRFDDIFSSGRIAHEGPRGVFAGPVGVEPGREQAGPGVGSFVPDRQTIPVREGGALGRA
jgi:hypothetical protein